jgi:cyanophycinase-like exopeptidase
MLSSIIKHQELIKNLKMKLLIPFLLIAFQISLSSQSYTSYFTGNALDTVVSPSGGICMMGGATEHDEAMKWFLQRCNGGDVLVLRATGSNGYNTYLYSQLHIPVHSVESIVCNNASASYDPYVLQKIMQAEGIWFAGGDQWDYVSYWRNTPVDSLINEAIQNRNIVIGGTSAGMAILGGYYFSAKNGSVTSGAALANPYTGKVTVDSAAFLHCPFLENVITDTHYDNPDRSGRHVAFLARILTDWGIEAKGIACDEYTAVCIGTDGIAHVYGDYPGSDDNAYFIQTNCESAIPNPEICSSGTPLTWNLNGEALKVYKIKGIFSGSNTFDVNDWKTGTGGEWENWYVNTGVMSISESDRIHCQSTAVEYSNQLDDEINIYPNPCHGTTLTIGDFDKRPEFVQLLDTNGRIMKTEKENQGKRIIVNVSGFYDGVYFLKMKLGNKMIVRKIIVF